MLIVELLSILMCLGVIAFGVYFLKFKKEKNRYSFVLGYLYALFGAIGLVTIMSLMK